MKMDGCSFTKAKSELFGNEKLPLLSETEVEVAHKNLLLSASIQSMLFIKRGWTKETILKFKLGWKDERVFIPIYNKEGALKNIRKYDVLHKSKNKFMGVEGHNSVELWPEKSLDYDYVVIMAGEPDTILANQLGIPAITFTSGEGSFKSTLLPSFNKKKVYVCYDPDNTGKIGAEKLSQAVTEFASQVFVINLPSKGGDFTDIFLKCTDAKENFVDLWNPLVENAIEVVRKKRKEIDISEIKNVDFHSAVKDEYYGKLIKFKAIAIGKNFSPYFAPRVITATCNFSKGDTCKRCKMFIVGGEDKIEIEEQDLLDLIKCSNTVQMEKIKQLLGIVGCNLFETKIETQTIEELFVAPIIDSERIDRQFVIRKCYSFGHNIQLNKIYSFTGRTIPDAKTQEATHLFFDQTPELTDLDTFKLSEEDVTELKRVFNPISGGKGGISLKFQDIYKDLTNNVPEVIIGREALLLAYDLVFHSVLKFKFLDSIIEKGWVELLTIGDTRTGKTKTAIKMCRHYRVGEYITLEAATLPGLVGGMSQVGREITFSWGVLPINDGRIAILDEVNGLNQKDISNLSSIRDNGIAERTVVGSTRKTSARVRLIWISNPRSMNTRISNYSSGVEAIRELIGRAEDISRFDFAMVVAKEDVDVMDINTSVHKEVAHVYTSDLCNKCVMWAWSRKSNQVNFTKDAERAVLDYAIEMSNKYSDTIPLVQGSVQRIKIAKLATAVACRLFSTDDGENVIVKKEHVDFVNAFLNTVYDSPYFGYEDFSKHKVQESTINDSRKIIETITNLPCKTFVDKMLSTNTILYDDICDFSGLGKETARELKSELVSANCLRRKKTFYVKTPEFVKLLKKIKSKDKEG